MKFLAWRSILFLHKQTVPVQFTCTQHWIVACVVAPSLGWGGAKYCGKCNYRPVHCLSLKFQFDVTLTGLMFPLGTEAFSSVPNGRQKAHTPYCWCAGFICSCCGWINGLKAISSYTTDPCFMRFLQICYLAFGCKKWREYKIAYIVTGLYIVFCVNLYACMVVVRARYSGAHVDACTEVYNFVVT